MTKGKTKKILVGGCFDILHYGHVVFLEKAKNLGGYLIVALESDKNIRNLKGKNRPIHNQKQRKKILESLKFVDEVIILKDRMTEKDYVDLINKVRPYQIAVTKGDPMLRVKKEQAKAVGAIIFEIPKIKTISTSKIFNSLHDSWNLNSKF